MRGKWCVVLYISLLLFCDANAEVLKLTVNKGSYSKYNTAVIPFACELDDNYLCKEVQNVLEGDLLRSGEFTLRGYDKQEVLRYAKNVKDAIDVIDLSKNQLHINEKFELMTDSKFPHSFLIVGRLIADNRVINGVVGENIILKFKLWDVLQNKVIIAKSVELPVSDIRRVAHISADMVYEAITGHSGHFDTKIAYSAITEVGGEYHSKIAIMDQDGYNVRYLDDVSDFCASPRLSPNVEDILYRRHNIGLVSIVHRNISSGEEHVIEKYNEVYSAPNFTPDGHYLVLAKSTGARTDIMKYDIATGKKKSLTMRSSINTTPSYTHDGKSIVFNSDRSGSQQLYIMNKDGSDQRRISFGTGKYGAPDCSPNNAYVTYVKMLGSSTSIGVMHLDGSKEREIVLPKDPDHILEKPTWSPNSQFILFSEESLSGESYLRVVDVTGYHSYEIPTETSATDPSWSRKLPLNFVGYRAN